MSVSTLSNQTIVIENPSGTRNKHGQAAFSAGVTSKCRFERTYKTVITAEREREPIHAIAGLPAATVVAIGARVTYGSNKYKVISVAEAPGANGSIHHREIMLQLWSFMS